MESCLGTDSDVGTLVMETFFKNKENNVIHCISKITANFVQKIISIYSLFYIWRLKMCISLRQNQWIPKIF